MNNLSHTEKNLFSRISEDNLSKFIESYERGDFIRKGARNEDGRTFLGEAIAKGALKITDYLSKDPEMVKMEDDNRKLPFFYLGASRNKKQILALLVKNNVDIAATSSDGRNILHALAPTDNGESWRKLIALGVREDKKDARNELPIDVAKRFNNMSVLRLNQIEEFNPK